MEFDENGLPKPGRELDAWIEEHVMKRRPLDGIYFWPSLAEVEAIKRDNPNVLGVAYEVARPFSTTHAYHSVMDALRPSYIWLFREDSTGIGVALRPIDCDGRPGSFWECNLDWNDSPDSERLYAHAVCAAVWMAMGGESI